MNEIFIIIVGDRYEKVDPANVAFSLALTMGNCSRYSPPSRKLVVLLVNLGEKEKRKRKYTSSFIKYLTDFSKATSPLQSNVVLLQRKAIAK